MKLHFRSLQTIFEQFVKFLGLIRKLELKVIFLKNLAILDFEFKALLLLGKLCTT
jgi:hypothetical protein